MKKLAVFDIDGTLRTERSPWRLLHRCFGVADKAADFVGQYQDKKIDYYEWVRRDAGLWQGVPRGKFMEALNDNPLRQGAGNLVDWFRSQTYDLLAISTGVDVLNNVTCQLLNIPLHISNMIRFDSHGLCTGEAEVLVTETSKECVLRDYLAKCSRRYDHIVAIGDSENDIPLFRLADNSWAVMPTCDAVRAAARLSIDSEPIDLIVQYQKQWQKRV